MEKGFHLEIISPVRTIFSGEVTSVTIPGSMGGFQVLKDHAPLIASFDIGRIRIQEQNESTEYSTSGGIFEVKNNQAIVLAESVETKDDIDLERANLAKQRAEQILNLAESEAEEKEEAKIALQRAINRIKIAEKK